MTRAICVAFHKYTPYGKEFYNPILDFFLMSIKKYEEEYDHLYLLASNWEIEPKKIEGMKVSIIRTNPNMRYYDCFKEVLPLVKEDLVLFMDNDMVIYKERIIDKTFSILQHTYSTPELKISSPWKKIDVVSIYASIGDYKTDKLNGKNKFCPFWFATRKELLTKYLDVDWGPDMPYCETFGHLTEKMLNNGIKPYEWEEDYSSLGLDGNVFWDVTGTGKSKDLGYYHIRAGSTPAYLLACRDHGDTQYWEYLKNQPKQEYLRQLAWYHYMELSTSQEPANSWDIIRDLNISQSEWTNYINKFKKFHGLA